MLLAIDTSTTLTGVACFDERGLRAELSWESGRDHSAQLLPQIDLLLSNLGLRPHDLRALAVALGPGSWSGLRVGQSTAKGIAIAQSLPLIGIGTLDALAFQHQRPALTIVPLIHLGRGRYGSAEYQLQRDKLQRSAEVAGRSLAEIAAAIPGRALFCGDTAAAQAELAAAMGSRAIFPRAAENLRRPGYLAELAWRRFVAGDTDEIAALEPIYLGQAVKS